MEPSALTRPLRPSVVLEHRHQSSRHLLSAKKSVLATQIAYRGDHLEELRRAARSTNDLVRSHYATFIHEVGRNIYPLIVFTDYEREGPCGVGSTLTLYRADGSITKVSPALKSNYELYKTCGHLMMGLAVEVGPYLANASLCSDDLISNGDLRGINADRTPSECQRELDSIRAAVPWRADITEYLRRVRVYRQALTRAVEEEAAVGCIEKLAIQGEPPQDNGEENGEERGCTSHGLPPSEMRETMFAMMTSVIDFCELCLSSGSIDAGFWEDLNQENFPRIKACMRAAVKAQADACVPQIVAWREMMGPEEWRGLYVVIPTVWAVGGENPRKTMMRQLMDPDTVDCHILTSEYPRDHGEARTLLGRVIGDRSIGRLVFGDETKDQRVKTMGLSSEVDVVQDDALPAIWDAMRENGCPVRKNRSSVHTSTERRDSVAGIRRPSFC